MHFFSPWLGYCQQKMIELAKAFPFFPKIFSIMNSTHAYCHYSSLSPPHTHFKESIYLSRPTMQTSPVNFARFLITNTQHDGEIAEIGLNDFHCTDEEKKWEMQTDQVITLCLLLFKKGDENLSNFQFLLFHFNIQKTIA